MSTEEEKEFTQEEKFLRYKQAGKIAYEVLEEELKPMIKPGIPVIEICKKAQEKIVEKDAKPSFPCNVSINHVAAHYTSPHDDETIIPEDAVVKVDIGTHIDGYIADKAITIALSSDFDDLVEASFESYKVGMDIIQPGLETFMVGRVIEEKTKEFGFLPLRELSGHLLDRHLLHGKKSLPNITLPYNRSESLVEVGEAYALETFASSGSGSVHEMSNKTYIYSLHPFNRAPVRSKTTKAIRKFIINEYRTLPFAERWLMENESFSIPRVRFALNELTRVGGLVKYGVLADERGCHISQHENTFIVTDDGPVTTTLPPFDFKWPSEEETETKESNEEEKET
jgi:methionyl aminopeptidase